MRRVVILDTDWLLTIVETGWSDGHVQCVDGIGPEFGLESIRVNPNLMSQIELVVDDFTDEISPDPYSLETIVPRYPVLDPDTEPQPRGMPLADLASSPATALVIALLEKLLPSWAKEYGWVASLVMASVLTLLALLSLSVLHWMGWI